jgi:hypothetical protein
MSTQRGSSVKSGSSVKNRRPTTQRTRSRGPGGSQADLGGLHHVDGGRRSVELDLGGTLATEEVQQEFPKAPR